MGCGAQLAVGGIVQGSYPEKCPGDVGESSGEISRGWGICSGNCPGREFPGKMCGPGEQTHIQTAFDRLYY